jgi:hypothetical protein
LGVSSGSHGHIYVVAVFSSTWLAQLKKVEVVLAPALFRTGGSKGRPIWEVAAISERTFTS